MTGRDRAVLSYLAKAPATREFLDKVTDLLRFLIPGYVSEGKRYLTIGNRLHGRAPSFGSDWGDVSAAVAPDEGRALAGATPRYPDRVREGRLQASGASETCRWG